MSRLRYTLVSDGPSDRALMPILDWLLRETGGVEAIAPQWADFSIGEKPRNLRDRLKFALQRFPCDLLFVHRDAEKQDSQMRYDEIQDAAKDLPEALIPFLVCVVPVRMQEGWLLFDEGAIRNAAGNPNGQVVLNLPKMTTVETISDPKGILHNQLKAASGLRGRRLKSFSVSGAAALVTQYASNFSQLRALPAFRHLESDIRLLCERGWS